MRQSTLFFVMLGAGFAALAGCSDGDANSPGGKNPNTPGANQPPLVSVSPLDDTVMELTNVSLQAKATDPDNDTLSYSWKQTAGTTVQIVKGDAAELAFKAPKVLGQETLVFEVTVDDGKGHKTIETAEVVVTEGELIVFAATRETANVGEVYRLHETDAAPVKLHDSLVPPPNADAVVAELLALSPTRRHVAYVVEMGTSEHLHIANIDGSGAVDVTQGLVDDADRISIFSWSPDGKRIAFLLSDSDEDINKVFVANADGTAVTPLSVTNPPTDTFSPSWSPDGKYLAFTQKIASDSRLVIADLRDEPKVREVGLKNTDQGVSVSQLQWSPKKNLLAFKQHTPDTMGAVDTLHVVNAEDDGSPREVSGAIASPTAGETTGVSSFAWSPNGERLAFTARAATIGGRDLFLTTADATDGSTPVAATPLGAGGFVLFLLWSPKSDRLAFTGDLNGENGAGAFVHDVFIADIEADGASNRRVGGTMPEPQMEAHVGAKELNWSPDGSHLAWKSDHAADGKFDLYVTPADAPHDSTPRRVNETITATGQTVGVRSVVWSPDSRSLLFTADTQYDEVFELWLADVHAVPGTAPTRLVEAMHFDADGTLDTDVDSARWHRNGERVLFLEDRAKDERYELFLLDPQSTDPPQAISGELVEGGLVYEYVAVSPLP